MRIAPIDPKLAPWASRPILWIMKRALGRRPTPYAVLARQPAALWSGFLAMLPLEASKRVEGRLKRLVSLRAAQMVGCPF